MDAASSSSTPAAVRPPVQSQEPPVWPRSAQLATLFLLAIATTLLAVHGWRGSRWGSRPTVWERADANRYQIDLNRADQTELLQIPGVGESLARRIEAYRLQHGAFQSVDDLRHVQGVGPTTLERLRPWLCARPVGTDLPAASVLVKGQRPSAQASRAAIPDKEPRAPRSVSKKATPQDDPINLNQATIEELQRLPGVGPKRAQMIVDERQKRPFKSIAELRRVSGIGPKTLEKLRPYLTVESEPVRIVIAGGP